MAGSSINRQNCNNMISALNNFAAKTEETCEKLNAAVGQCKQVLGEGDVIFEGLTGDQNAILNQYIQAALYAKEIAAGIQKDLDLIDEARKNASSQLDGE